MWDMFAWAILPLVALIIQRTSGAKDKRTTDFIVLGKETVIHSLDLLIIVL